MTSLSIVTVTLNSARHIRGAIDSIVAQDDGQLQYVVIDGASTDGTVEIVESYRPKFGDRLVVVSEKDNGLYDAMNKGIALATGDVIGILNSDDRYLPGALHVIRHPERSEGNAPSSADVVFGNVEMVDGSERWIHRATLDGIRDRMTLGHPAVFVRRSAYEKWGVFDTRYKFNADYDLMLRLYLGGAKFRHADQVLAQFQSGGVSSRDFDKRLRELYDIQRRHFGRAHA